MTVRDAVPAWSPGAPGLKGWRPVLRLLPALLVLVVLLGTIPPPSPGAAQPADGAGSGAGPSRGVLGYYVPYAADSWYSLRENIRTLDLVAAQWVTIDACGNLSSRDDQTLKEFVRSHGVGLFPSLLTMSGPLNHHLLTDQAVAAHAITQIVEYVVAEGYDGFDLDLEGVEPRDRQAYTDFVGALAMALHAQGKGLSLALAPKTRDVTTGWAGAYDYAALGAHADLITLMAYEFSGPWSAPGSIAPYDWIDQVLAFANSQIPPEKVLLGLGFYGYDWNTTSGTARSLGYSRAARLAERYQVPISLDPITQSATFRYEALAGESLPPLPPEPSPQHEITVREAPPCPLAFPTPTPRPTPTPPPYDAIQQHEVWFEIGAGVAARLGLADRHRVGGVATWRLGLEDPQVWPLFQQWRSGR